MLPKRKANAQGGPRRSKTTHFISHGLDRDGEQSPSTFTVDRLHTTYSSSSSTRSGLSSRSTVISTQPSPTKNTPLSFKPGTHESSPYDESALNIQDDAPILEHFEDVDPSYHWKCHEQSEQHSTKRPRYASDQPLRQWLPHRQEWLDELIRLEGRGDSMHASTCGVCLSAEGIYRCTRCFSPGLRCQQCTVERHADHPLHLIECWNGQFFHRTTLKTLGLRVQLMHPRGKCINPVPAVDGFVVIDIDSIQKVAVDYCGCARAPDPNAQLLRSRWFPATTITPSTVATHRVLAHYHLSTVQSKVSAFDFYQTIERRTDNTELAATPDRYSEFLRMARMWRHLKLLKRAGRGACPDGVATTEEGELALPCPACPHPGINLPDDWEARPEEEQWLYNLILAIDANFRLRRRMVSSDEADPPLGSGWAYFVEHIAYNTHLSGYQEQKEISSCSNYAAISNANSKSNKGLAVTGVGACVCARHQLLRPNGVGNLQRGERYCNMDYILFATLRSETIQRLVISYDISCQWYKNLWKRMHELPPGMHLDLSRTLVRFVIPKFHLPAHHPPCHAPFSFNYALGVGRTDGEGIERDWSIINPVSYSTREMTPGHRADTLDDHWGDWNWRKIAGMGLDCAGRALARKVRAAVPERIKHMESFRTMCDALPSARVDEWTSMVEAWEQESAVKEPRDVTAPNPYEYEVSEITQAEVRLQLAQADATSAAAGNVTMHECTPAQFIIAGIELEEEQLRIRDDRRDLINGMAPLKAALQERRNLLKRKLDAWELIQAVYMPYVPQQRIDLVRRLDLARTEPPFAREPEEHRLFLPSEIAGSSHDNSRDLVILVDLELKLCEGQAHDALRHIRHYLQLLTFSHKYKNQNCRGQHENTRAGSLIKRTEAKKAASCRRYRLAYKALIALNPAGPWSRNLRELKDGDVRGLTDPTGSESEGRRVVSWIWAVPGVGMGSEAEDEGLHDTLRVEWCKTRARALRWREEIQLLRAEMDCVDKWLAWRASWWEGLDGKRSELSPQLKDGLQAHLARQACLYQDMRDSFATMGKKARDFVETEVAHAEGAKKTD